MKIQIDIEINLNNNSYAIIDIDINKLNIYFVNFHDLLEHIPEEINPIAELIIEPKYWIFRLFGLNIECYDC
jgi:hypothetical protein